MLTGLFSPIDNATIDNATKDNATIDNAEENAPDNTEEKILFIAIGGVVGVIVIAFVVIAIIIFSVWKFKSR